MNLRPASFTRAALASLVLLALCPAWSTPVMEPRLDEERLQGKGIQLGKVLVVMDIRLDVQSSAGDLIRRSAASYERVYSPLAQMMSEAVAAKGGTPTVVYALNTDDIPSNPAEYSQVWTQQLTSAASFYRPGGERTMMRGWRSTIAHRAAPGEELRPVYQARFSSDCFLPHAWSGGGCEEPLREFVAGQLRNYANGTTTAQAKALMPPPETVVTCLPHGAQPGELRRLPIVGIVRVRSISAVNAECSAGSVTGTVEVQKR